MAKINPITKGLTGLKNTVSSINSIVKSTKEIAPVSESEEMKADAPKVIETLDQMGQWISSLKTEASKPAAMVLQQQLNVLNYIESPSMSGMMVDNIIVCLHKSLEAAENEEQKIALRESVTALLQSVLFMSEAKLTYDVKKNKEDAIELISNAGNMLTESVTAMVCVMIPGAPKAALPAVKNVLSSNKMSNAVSMFLTAKKRQEIIDERIRDHNKMLNNLFNTFDRYFDIIGPSIQIHGMLSRYQEKLIHHYRQERYDELESYTEKLTEQSKSWISDVRSTVNNSLGNSKYEKIIKGVVDIIGIVVDATKKPETLDYNEIKQLRSALQSKYESVQEKIGLLESEINSKEEQIETAGVFQGNLKRTLRSEISDINQQIQGMKNEQIDIDEKIRIIADVLEPVEKCVSEYTANLERITEKYAIL